jgi:hypothetical protein
VVWGVALQVETVLVSFLFGCLIDLSAHDVDFAVKLMLSVFEF